jgi:hypothetical protein
MSAQQPVLARLGERDRHALAAGPADPADAVHVRLRRRRDVVVDDVREVLDVEPAGGDVGGDEQVGRPGAEPAHHPVALLLAHPAVQRLGAVAAPLSVSVSSSTSSRVRQKTIAASGLDVEDPAERGRLVRARTT